MRAHTGSPQRKFVVGCLLGLVLVSLLTATPTYAQGILGIMVRVTGRVISADPGLIPGGVINGGTIFGGTFVEPGGDFSFMVWGGYFAGGATLHVNFYSYPRYPKTVDVWINCSWLDSWGDMSCDPVAPFTISVASMYGNVEGTVRDERGGLIAGAVVTAVPVEGGSSTQATTDARGFYRFASTEPIYPMWAFFFITG